MIKLKYDLSNNLEFWDIQVIFKAVYIFYFATVSANKSKQFLNNKTFLLKID
jgi:hypothetical protein